MKKTRKGFVARLLHCFNEYNLLESADFHLYTDEWLAIKFLAGRSEEFLREVHGIWGLQKPNCTPLPLSLIVSKWLLPEEHLTLAATNPTWKRNLAKTEAAYVQWIRRVKGKSDLALKAKGCQRVKISSEDNAELIFRAACTISNNMEDLKEIFRTTSVLSLKLAAFEQGALDSDLLPACRQLSKTWSVRDLRFVSDATVLETLGMGSSAGCELDQAMKAKQQADFQHCFEMLRWEENTFRRHVQNVKQFHAESHSAITSSHERLHDALAACVDEHMKTCYVAAAAESLLQASTCFVGHAQAIADSSPAIQLSAVAKIGMWHLPALGQNNIYTKEILQLVAADLAQSGTGTCHIIFLPNCPESKKGPSREMTKVEKQKTMVQSVSQHQAAVRSPFVEREDLMIIHCTGMFEETSQTGRPQRVDFLMVVSGAADVRGESLLSRWHHSKVFKRQCLSTPLPHADSQKWRNWTAQIHTADGQRVNAEQELRQAFSGRGLYKALLSDLIKDTGFTGQDRIQVCDYCMYDAELGVACLELNSVSSSDCPRLYYVGTYWQEPLYAETVRGHAHDTIRNEMLPKCLANIYEPLAQAVQLARNHNPAASRLGTEPVLQEAAFSITKPRGEELPIRQTVMDQWESHPDLVNSSGLNWKTITRLHDKEFNPAGVPYKAGKREQASSEQSSRGQERPIDLPAVEGAPGTKEELLELDAMEVKSADDKHVTFMVTPEGEFFIIGKVDWILPQDEALFTVRGTWTKGKDKCQELRKNNSSWVACDITSDSLVVVLLNQADGLEWPTHPMPLGAFLQYVEGKGKVRIDFKTHEYKRDPDDPSKYIVTPKDEIMLSVVAIEGLAFVWKSEPV